MPLPRLEQYLQENRVTYRVVPHDPAFTAQEVAASAHVPGKEMAKSVMVELDGRLTMVVLPAHERVHLGQLREAAGAQEVRLASETEFMDRFPGCELGAMPPFGNLYGIEVLVSDSLAEDENIAFNAGNHREVMWLSYADFDRLAHPRHLSMRKH